LTDKDLNWLAIKKGERIRKKMQKIKPDSYFMSEAELTDEQRECKKPIGTKGYYRMYKWICNICGKESVRLPLSKAMQEGTIHSMENHNPDLLNPPVRVIGGVFELEKLYT
jgi:hypothetical protein